MSDPPRLLRSSQSLRVRQLLAAGREERPRVGSLQRTLLAVGSGPVAVAGTSALSNAVGTQAASAGAEMAASAGATANGSAAQVASGAIGKAASTAAAAGKAGGAAGAVATTGTAATAGAAAIPGAATTAGAAATTGAAVAGGMGVAIKCAAAGAVLWGAVQLPSAWQAEEERSSAPPSSVVAEKTAEEPAEEAEEEAAEEEPAEEEVAAPAEHGAVPARKRASSERWLQHQPTQSDPNEAALIRHERTGKVSVEEAPPSKDLAAPVPTKSAKGAKVKPRITATPRAKVKPRAKAEAFEEPPAKATPSDAIEALPTKPQDSERLGSNLSAELEQVARADAALRRGQARQTLALLEGYEQRFAPAQLRVEVLALRMEAWQSLGEGTRARAIASYLLRSDAAKAHARRAREILELPEAKR